MLSIRGRVVAVIGVGVFTGAIVVVSAGGAAALGTFPCNQKGTAGNNTIAVSVPAGHTDAAHPWVVCPGNGNDTVNINNVTAFGPAYLYIAMGNGAKTVNWNAGNVNWGAAYLTPTYPGGGIITRPEANPDIVATGTNGDSLGSTFDCATNLQYRAATSQQNLNGITGDKFLGWAGGGTQNAGHC
jgi:hypothetical protein